MKTIIAAIDFSDYSINALEHAVSIAKFTNSNLLMVWVNNPKITKILLSSDLSTDLIDEVELQFSHLITKYSGQLGGMNIDFIIREGKVYKEVIALAESAAAWLIVTGTHGSSGFEEFWMGSNAYKIVSSAPCPTLTINGGRTIDKELERIVLPIDNTPETRHKAPIVAELARYFKAQVHILSLFTSQFEELRTYVKSYANQVNEYLKNEGIETIQQEVVCDNLTTATIDYAKIIDANLIAIMTEQEKSPRNIIIGPYAQQMVHHSPVPVLSINAVK